MAPKFSFSENVVVSYVYQLRRSRRGFLLLFKIFSLNSQMKRRESQALLEQIRKRGSRGSGTMTGTDTNASSIVIEDEGGGGVDSDLIGNGNGCDESGGGGGSVDC